MLRAILWMLRAVLVCRAVWEVVEAYVKSEAVTVQLADLEGQRRQVSDEQQKVAQQWEALTQHRWQASRKLEGGRIARGRTDLRATLASRLEGDTSG
eukprot:474871-Prorocentrum_minimum.AAC.1